VKRILLVSIGCLTLASFWLVVWLYGGAQPPEPPTRLGTGSNSAAPPRSTPAANAGRGLEEVMRLRADARTGGSEWWDLTLEQLTLLHRSGDVDNVRLRWFRSPS